MPITFDKLFSFLESKGENKNFLRENGIYPNTVDRLIKNKPVSTEIIERVCRLLDAQPGDLMAFIPETEETNKDSG